MTAEAIAKALGGHGAGATSMARSLAEEKSIGSTLHASRLDFLCRADDRLGQMHLIDYARQHGIDLGVAYAFAGLCAVIPITDCGNGRFDFRDTDEDIESLVCEALGADGETCTDLVAWPLSDPGRVMTIFGRAVIIGEWASRSPFTYAFAPLTMHRNPLEWLKAGCDGAAIVDATKAGRALVDLPGQIAARDAQHGRELSALIDAVYPSNKIVVPIAKKVAA
jgi:hypothetical protein